MQESKTIGLILILLLGTSLAVNAKAEEMVTTTTTKTVVTSVKKQPLKSVKPQVKKQVKGQKPARVKTVKAKARAKALKMVMAKPQPAAVSPTPVPVPRQLPVPPANPSAANTLVMNAKPEESKLSAAVSAEFYPENEVQKDSNALYYLIATYKLSPKHKFEFTGRVAQSFIPQEGKEASVQALDPKFDYFYTFTDPDQKSFELKMRFRNIPGWSEDSQINGIRAFNSVRLEFKKPIGDFVFGLRPYVGHYWTEYAVNIKNEPLPLFSVGHNLIMGYKLTSKLSWCIEVDTGFKMLQPEEVKAAATLAEANGTALKNTDTVRTALFVGTEVAYQFTKSFATRLGYQQDDGMMADGRYALNMFGRETSRYYVGLDYAF